MIIPDNYVSFLLNMAGRKGEPLSILDILLPLPYIYIATPSGPVYRQLSWKTKPTWDLLPPHMKTKMYEFVTHASLLPKGSGISPFDGSIKRKFQLFSDETVIDRIIYCANEKTTFFISDSCPNIFAQIMGTDCWPMLAPSEAPTASSWRTFCTFSFRAECESDLNTLLKNDKFKSNLVEYDYTVDKMGLPDVDVTFKSTLDIRTLREIMETIPDGHVMYQTLNYAKDYTGERYYHGDDSEEDTVEISSHKEEITELEAEPLATAEKLANIVESESESEMEDWIDAINPPQINMDVFDRYETVKKHWTDWVYIGADEEFSRITKDELDSGFLDDMECVNRYLRLCSDDEDAFYMAVNNLQPSVEKGKYKFSKKVLEQIVKYRGNGTLVVDKNSVKEVPLCHKHNPFYHCVPKKIYMLGSLTAHLIEYLNQKQ